MQNNSFDVKDISQDTINSFKLSMNPNAIPDMGEMLEIVNEMISFIETPEMQLLEKANFPEFETRLYGMYNAKLPMKVISLMTEADRYDNLDELINMFDVLNDIKEGKKNMQEEFEKFNEGLNKKYLYDPHGGKENFEKTFATQTVPEKKKKTRKHKKSTKNILPVNIVINETN